MTASPISRTSGIFIRYSEEAEREQAERELDEVLNS